jgi:hypothetical protein
LKARGMCSREQPVPEVQNLHFKKGHP